MADQVPTSTMMSCGIVSQKVTRPDDSNAGRFHEPTPFTPTTASITLEKSRHASGFLSESGIETLPEIVPLTSLTLIQCYQVTIWTTPMPSIATILEQPGINFLTTMIQAQVIMVPQPPLAVKTMQ